MFSNLQKILNELESYPKTTLVVVTKNRSIDEIKKVIEAGITDIGENRIQSAEQKLSNLKITKHLIGHLQTNKVRKAVEIFDMIQSIDSFKLIEKINQECQKINKVMPILLQINIFEDENKYGFKTKDLNAKIINELSQKYKNIEIQGLMTIAKQDLTEKQTLAGFQKLTNLHQQISKTFTIHHSPFTILSMGMSQDYQLALKAGSNMLRIGSAIFESK
ncbi:YggS family pyridoxal phosphate enzyme [Candidatus Peregrinibacteria bacterium RIFOXYB2_FULL_32_7]|nr:MAG: YggS family pyridoxal phosphate enzyme [Candidatus Peregrinibacteria bacterium RIFOXYB2_FULL_32_7]